MATQYGNRIRVLVSASDTTTASLGAAVAGCQDLSAISSGSTIGYAIDDGTNWEVGTGTYTAGSPSTLSRDVIESSSNGGAAIFPLSDAAQLVLTLTAAQINALLSATGPTGPSGLTGPTGPTGAAGPAGSSAGAMMLLVNGDLPLGILTDSSGVPIYVQ